MKNLIIRFWPLGFILLIWFIFSYPYFFQNKVPYSSTYQVNHFFPWSAYEKYWGPVKNGAMPDIVDQIYPWRYFTIETWKSGEIPFWNPNSFSGNPHLANYQSTVLSPFNIFFFVLPFIDAWSILILLQPLLAGVFTYLLLREFKVSKVGSLIGAIAFMFSGFMVVWMAYGTLSWSITFLPLALFSIERWFNKRSPSSLFLLAISIPLSFFSGHFQTSLYFFLFTSLFLGFKVLNKFKKSVPLILSFLLGVIISLLQIIPSIQFYLESTRSQIFSSAGAIPFFYLVNIFAPDFFGNPVTRNDWFGFYAEWASFIGIITFSLALLGFTKKNRLSLFFLAIGVLALILSLDSPVQRFITSLKIPVISTSNTNRMIVLASFSFAVLSGFGFDKLKEIVNKRLINKIIPITFAIGALFASIWLSISVFNIMPFNKESIAQRNFILPTAIFGSFFLIVLLSSFLKDKRKNLLLYLILVFVSFDSLRFAQKWMPADPKKLVFPRTPIISGIRENIGYGRIFGNFGANIDTYYGFPSIEGYDPLYVGRYGEFIRSAASGKFQEGERSVVRIARRGEFTDRVLDLLSVSLIFHPIADTNQNWAFPVWEDRSRFTLVFQDEKFQLFKNNKALKRTELFYDYEIIKDDRKIVERFYSRDFDFRNKLILEEDPDKNFKFQISNFKLREGSARIISYSPNKVIIETKTSSPALLFLSDNLYPGWRVYVNGKETKIYRADYSFRAVVVPNGESLVKFSYKPF